MKKISIILLFTFSVYNSFSQQKIQLRPEMSVDLPKTMTVLSKSELSAYTNTRLKYNPGTATFFNDHANNVFKRENVLILLVSSKIKPNLKLVTEMKKAFDESSKGFKNYYSEIGNVDERTFMFSRSDIGEGLFSASFFCPNSDGTFVLSGKLLYTPQDEVKAKNTLKDIIRSTKFEEH